MPSWLRGMPFNSYPEKAITSSSLPCDVDQVAAFNAFIRHWQQIMEVFENSKKRNKVSCDDVTAVINHFGQMINFLLVDLRQMMKDCSLTGTITAEEFQDNPTISDPSGEINNGGDIDHTPSFRTPIFDHFLGERVLQAILQWSKSSREFFNILQLEQLKVYETLLSNSHPEILIYKPITEPLISLLDSCSGRVPVEVEKRLLVLLNQLWVSLMHNQHLIKYFFLPNDPHPPKFLIFSLLLPFIHREGSIGQQARDALLLSMSLSATHTGIAEYVCRYSNFCPVLAAGLSGLYCMLPRSLNIKTEGWYRISPEDVSSISALQMFANSLGFCNAIVQIADSEIQKQLVDYLYQGFLVSVVGPALIQNVLDEVVAAIAFMEFFLQSVTEEKLRRAFLALLLSPQDYSDLPLLTSIISHLHSPNMQLNLVTLNLFHTLISLHCEDAMMALIFQYLTPCNHVMLSQRSKLSQPPFSAAERFLELLPTICQVEMTMKTQFEDHASDPEGQRLQVNSLSHTSSSENTENCSISLSPSLLVYLKEARLQIEASHSACSSWTWKYNVLSPSPTDATALISAAKLIPVIPYSKPHVHSDPCSQSLPYEMSRDPFEGAKRRSSSLPDYTHKKDVSKKGEASTHHGVRGMVPATTDAKPSHNGPPANLLLRHFEAESRLDSLGESSGYESFNLKGSRDSSPLHSCGSSSGHSRVRVEGQQSNSVSGGSNLSNTNGTASQDKGHSFDEGFFQFLDQTPAQDIVPEVEEDLQFIDHFHEMVGDNSARHQLSGLALNEVLDSDLQSPWLTGSMSSAEEEDHEGTTSLLPSHPKPTIGPFLEALISQIDTIFSSNIDATLLAMRCISALASYPCPLLTSLLLQPSVVLQPAVRSLYQVLGQVKQKIDSILRPQDYPILVDARLKFQLSLNVDSTKDHSSSASSSPPPSIFVRGSDKRRSFTQTVSAFFKRTPPLERNSNRETLQNLPDGAGYRYINVPSSPTWKPPSSPFFSAPAEKRQAAICAVLIQEWLLELAALAQEHTVHCLAIRFASFSLSTTAS